MHESKLLLWPIMITTPYIIRFALVDQATQEVFCVIPYVGSGVPKYHIRVIAIVQDSCTFDIKRQRVLKPEMVVCWVLPGVCRVSIKSVDRDNAKWRGEHQPSQTHLPESRRLLDIERVRLCNSRFRKQDLQNHVFNRADL